ncbi:60S ribosomal uL30 domain-containing protein [Magnusiomyces paraingens]|uniref:Ribosomal protein L30 ferredoxin-like fold domain-containing protein n=1 Tax=Magnusiomyces paraingens TaxID=2606893 RepID=A0A5E8BDH0_9ASCO|nr:uncharacterized protein SAPINGB_P001927 [Saprochaete ingens]VVT48739.1 unnamed protein product [Saprochaete ingens]
MAVKNKNNTKLAASKEPALPDETLLKKRKNNDSHRQRLSREAQAKKKAAEEAEKKKRRAAQFKRAETFVKHYRTSEQEQERIERTLATSARVEIPSEPKLLFVVRIKSDTTLVPQARRILNAMRLQEINNGVFVRLTEGTAELLRIVEPFVAFGYPTLNSVRTLIYKRGYTKASEGETGRVPITDNTIIEEALGDYGIICMEDLIHEIYALGPNFKKAANFLYPFQLSSPTGGWGVRSKFKKFIEGEGLGERAQDINALIEAQN